MCGSKPQEIVQRTELDPALQRLLYGGTLANPMGGFGGGGSNNPSGGGGGSRTGGNTGAGGTAGRDFSAMPNQSTSPGYRGIGDMLNGGGPGQAGPSYQGLGRISDVANAITGRPPVQRLAVGGYVAPQMGIGSLNQGQMPMMNGQFPNLSDPMTAATLAMAVQSPQMQYGSIMAPQAGYAQGGYIQGPGTGKSDSVPATIYQNGMPVQDARLSNGEFVMTENAVRGAGNGDREAGAARMYEMMKRFERGGRV